MTLEDANNAIEELSELASGFYVAGLASILLNNPDFKVWSGSSQSRQHHYGNHGLVIHTHEVVITCLKMAEFYPQYNIDKTELYLASLYHDAGKMYDYKRSSHGVESVWTAADHKRYIHHISRSALIWNDAVKTETEVFQNKYADSVLHAILSHHGLREWGSPVAPKSRVAWLLHLCDGISARLYDADTWDTVHK